MIKKNYLGIKKSIEIWEHSIISAADAVVEKYWSPGAQTFVLEDSKFWGVLWDDQFKYCHQVTLPYQPF